MTLSTVEVLLATYNGERFLREQIDSILAQDYRPLHITARDDHSTDNTRMTLMEYAQRYPETFRLLPVSEEPGRGARWNFLRLMEASKSPYVAFADQDDVWLPDKLTRMMECMRRLEQRNPSGAPLLAFSDLQVVDETLKPISESLWALHGSRPERIHTLRHMLMQNVATGCTMLINRSMVELALHMPEEAFLHDRWIALLATAFGDADFLRKPTVLYRQHGTNAVGAGRLRGRRLPNFSDHTERSREWEIIWRQAEGLARVHSTLLSPAQSVLLKSLLKTRASSSRLGRILTCLRHGLLLPGLKKNLSSLLYLWVMRPDKKDGV